MKGMHCCSNEQKILFIRCTLQIYVNSFFSLQVVCKSLNYGLWQMDEHIVKYDSISAHCELLSLSTVHFERIQMYLTCSHFHVGGRESINYPNV